MHIQHDPGRGPRLSPPPAYDDVVGAPNAHVPIAHPVVVDPFPALPAPQLNSEHTAAHGLPDIGELHRHPSPRQDAPVTHTMYTPPLDPPLQAPQPRNPLQALPPVSVPRPLPLPPSLLQ
jgi:hypothetical protein